jgi:hypothetical protein
LSIFTSLFPQSNSERTISSCSSKLNCSPLLPLFLISPPEPYETGPKDTFISYPGTGTRTTTTTPSTRKRNEEYFSKFSSCVTRLLLRHRPLLLIRPRHTKSTLASAMEMILLQSSKKKKKKTFRSKVVPRSWRIIINRWNLSNPNNPTRRSFRVPTTTTTQHMRRWTRQ